jgi:hypothetical protein
MSGRGRRLIGADTSGLVAFVPRISARRRTSLNSSWAPHFRATLGMNAG